MSTESAMELELSLSEDIIRVDADKNSSIKIIGSARVKLSITIGQVKKVLEVSVPVEDNFCAPFLLGIDLMEPLRIAVNQANNTVSLECEKNGVTVGALADSTKV